MGWYVVSFDRRADPSRDYDMIFLGEVLRKYERAGEPSGFAVFERLLPGGHLHAYYFSPVSVSYCESLLDDHLGFDRGSTCPEDAKFLLGDEKTDRGESSDSGLQHNDEPANVAEAIRRDDELSSFKVTGRAHEEVMRAATRALRLGSTE